MNKVIEEIANIGIVPVIMINDAGKAVALAEALKSGGIPCIEVTFGTPAAAEAMKKIASSVEGMLIGAGTVTTTHLVDLAVASGAKYIVSPGLNETVVKYCLEKEIPIIPGVITPFEIEKAMEYGLNTVKFFPAEQSGGVAMIKALSGPYGSLKFIPTGGITETNINDYLALDCITACGGSFVADPSIVDSDRFDEITFNIIEGLGG